MSIESKTRSSNLVGPICHLGKDLISAVPLFCSLSLLSSRLRTLPQTEEWVFRYSLLPTCLLNQCENVCSSPVHFLILNNSTQPPEKTACRYFKLMAASCPFILNTIRLCPEKLLVQTHYSSSLLLSTFASNPNQGTLSKPTSIVLTRHDT